MLSRQPGGQYERWVKRELLHSLHSKGKLEMTKNEAAKRYVSLHALVSLVLTLTASHVPRLDADLKRSAWQVREEQPRPRKPSPSARPTVQDAASPSARLAVQDAASRSARPTVQDAASRS